MTKRDKHTRGKEYLTTSDNDNHFCSCYCGQISEQSCVTAEVKQFNVTQYKKTETLVEIAMMIMIIKRCAGGPTPPASWPFDLESGVRVACDVGYLCANFSLPRPLCSRIRPDIWQRVVKRQTHIIALCPCPYPRGRGIINTTTTKPAITTTTKLRSASV